MDHWSSCGLISWVCSNSSEYLTELMRWAFFLHRSTFFFNVMQTSWNVWQTEKKSTIANFTSAGSFMRPRCWTRVWDLFPIDLQEKCERQIFASLGFSRGRVFAGSATVYLQALESKVDVWGPGGRWIFTFLNITETDSETCVAARCEMWEANTAQTGCLSACSIIWTISSWQIDTFL